MEWEGIAFMSVSTEPIKFSIIKNENEEWFVYYYDKTWGPSPYYPPYGGKIFEEMIAALEERQGAGIHDWKVYSFWKKNQPRENPS